MSMNIAVAICHNSISIILELFTIYVFGVILFPKSKISRVIEFNLSIKIYMFSTILFCIFSLPLETYYYLVWPDEKPLNAYFVWWAGMLQSMALMAIPIAVLFLSIDRCLIIAFPNSEHKRKPIIISLTLISILAACGVSLWFDDIQPYPKLELSPCRDFTCLLNKASITIYLMIKLFITFAIVAVGIICCWLIRKNMVGTGTHASLNKIIFFTLANTVIFDIGPYLVDVFLYFGLGIDLNKVLGPYRTFMAALDAGVCAMSYYKVIARRMKAPKTTPAVTNSKEKYKRDLTTVIKFVNIKP